MQVCNIFAEEHGSRIGSEDSGCLSTHKGCCIVNLTRMVGGRTNGKKAKINMDGWE